VRPSSPTLQSILSFVHILPPRLQTLSSLSPALTNKSLLSSKPPPSPLHSPSQLLIQCSSSDTMPASSLLLACTASTLRACMCCQTPISATIDTLRMYPVHHEAGVYDGLNSIMTDFLFRCPSQRWANNSASRSPQWVHTIICVWF
jgi:hypothetical protein